MQAPFAVFIHGPDLPDVLDRNVRVGLVGTKHEVAPVFLEVPAFAEPEVAVFGVVLEAVLFERDCRAWVVVAVLAVAWWVRVLVPVLPVAVPTAECFIQLFESCLTGLCVEVLVAFVGLEVGLECGAVGNLAASIPDPLRSPSATFQSLLAANPSESRSTDTCESFRMLAICVRVTSRIATRSYVSELY
jgi:hypothetical protein